jgi:hypothetical protein
LTSSFSPPYLRDDNPGMEDVVQEYIGALAAEQRLLFDRLHRLVLEMYPAAEVVLS